MLTRLAQEAADLREESYDSARVELWKQRAGAHVEQEYGDSYFKIFKQILLFMPRTPNARMRLAARMNRQFDVADATTAIG